MGKIVLVRHGQASFGRANYDELSDLGQQQALQLGTVLQQRLPTVKHVVCGSMVRHQQTAHGCLTNMQKEATWSTDAGFNEYDHEEVIVRYKPAYADRAVMLQEMAQSSNPHRTFQNMFAAAVLRWIGGEHDHDYQESWHDFKQRVHAALNHVKAELDNKTGNTDTKSSKTALVFTSGGVITAVAQDLLGVPDDQIFKINWSLANAAITTVLYSGDLMTLSTLNDYSHFEQLQSKQHPSFITYR